MSLERLLRDVFDPQPGEKVLVMTDEPHDGLADNASWADRRQWVDNWLKAFQNIGADTGLEVHPLLVYPATGMNNGPLPEFGRLGRDQVRLKDILDDTNIAVAVVEYSATAPLITDFIGASEHLRAGTNSRAVRDMEHTALAADYREVYRRAHLLAERLAHAVGARARFSTGDETYFDLRYRVAGADDGHLPRDRKGHRVGNLPAGEAFKAPYEGERRGEPSRTEGTLPVVLEGELVRFRVRGNRIIEVESNGPQGRGFRTFFDADPARRNIAELGLGVNDKAVVRGIPVEDEKVPGLHWAYGRSDHLGGTVGPAAFLAPGNAIHRDLVYCKGAPIGVASVTLVYGDGSEEQILRDNVYQVF